MCLVPVDRASRHSRLHKVNLLELKFYTLHCTHRKYKQDLGSHANALIENNGVGAADGVPLRKRRNLHKDAVVVRHPWRCEAGSLGRLLVPLEDKLQIELEIHTKKRWSTFDTKHASLIAAHKEATKRARKASTQYGSSKRRIARKGGWGCSSYRDVLRSPYERDDEEDNM